VYPAAPSQDALEPAPPPLGPREVTDHAEPDPEPAPSTSIGWRLVHPADRKVMYHHDPHRGAEIGCLRDLYRAAAAGGG
jgi:hypothetical protein